MWRIRSLRYLQNHGLRRSTENDLAIYKKCLSSAVSLSNIWEDVNDQPKIIKWDDEWEKYLEHRAAVIDEEGRKKYLPWNAYESLGLKWLDGYNFVQLTGDCASFGHRNSLKASNLTNALRTGRTPREIAHSMLYSIARGDGTPQFGSGCNLAPLAKYSSENGNYWTDDFGKYDTGAYCRKYKKDSIQDEHAKQTQSIIVFLPEPSFEYLYKATRAGFGVNIGSSVFPAASKVNKDDIAVVSGWDSGGHSTAVIAAHQGKSGEPYVYLENSHPTPYASDSLNPGKAWGAWLRSKDVRYMSDGAFTYGAWYVNVGELPK